MLAYIPAPWILWEWDIIGIYIYIYGIVMDIYGLLMGYYWLVGG